MAEAPDQPHAVHLARFLLEAPDEQHLAIGVEVLVFVDLWCGRFLGFVFGRTFVGAVLFVRGNGNRGLPAFSSAKT